MNTYDIENRNFSFIQFYPSQKGYVNNKPTLHYITDTPDKKQASIKAKRFLTTLEDYERFDIYPRNYVKDARILLQEGKIID